MEQNRLRRIERWPNKLGYDVVTDLYEAEVWQTRPEGSTPRPLLIEAQIALKGIVAALSQPKTFPADIEAAKDFARALLAKLEKEG